jgi:hypothetical protein
MAAPLPPILNKNNEFPIPDNVWDKMWARIKMLYPEREGLEEQVRGKTHAAPPLPRLPCVPTATVQQQLNAIQRYVESLEYNHIGALYGAFWEGGERGVGGSVLILS